MTMKKMMIVLIGILTLILNIDAARQGRGRGYDGHKGPDGMRMMRMIEMHGETLGLSDQQKKEITTLCTANAEHQVALTNKNNLLQLEMDKLMSAEKRDYAKIKTIMNQMGENRVEKRLNSLKIREKMMTVLTPEQRKLMAEQFGSRMGREHRFNRSGKKGRMPMGGRQNRGIE